MFSYIYGHNQFSNAMSLFAENEYATYHIQEDILFITYKKGIVINLATAIQIVEDRLSLQEGLSYPVLCDIREVRCIDKAARDYLAVEGSLLIDSVAYLVEPTVSKTISEFYIHINTPAVASKNFTDVEAAKAFLRR